MSESMLAILKDYDDRAQAYRRYMPEIGSTYDELPAEVYKDGLLSAKTKRLMAVCSALCTGCQGCILFQADLALKAGATAEELLEAAAVALSLGGTQGMSKATWLVGLLEERGLLASSAQ